MELLNNLYAAEHGYTGVQESIYVADHPDVIYWTVFFQERFKSLNIFEDYQYDSIESDFYKAKAVGTQWYRFSSFMPWFLCRAASMVDTNIKRHYVIQTAFEELGMRNADEIHPEMFKDATRMAGLVEADYESMKSYPAVTIQLEWLANALIDATSDDEVMGLLLGLECPAEENIDTLFNSLGINAKIKSKLEKTKFFKLHRAIETEHVRLTISNFLRFSIDEEARNNFTKGYDLGITFWLNYWKAVSALTIMLRNRALDEITT